jgi:hypothetical protein
MRSGATFKGAACAPSVGLRRWFTQVGSVVGKANIVRPALQCMSSVQWLGSKTDSHSGVKEVSGLDFHHSIFQRANDFNMVKGEGRAQGFFLNF